MKSAPSGKESSQKQEQTDFILNLKGHKTERTVSPYNAADSIIRLWLRKRKAPSYELIKRVYFYIKQTNLTATPGCTWKATGDFCLFLLMEG